MFKKLVLTGLTSAIIATSGFTQAQSTDTHATIIFDNTGSMNRTRADGNNRCDFAKQLFKAGLSTYMKTYDKLNVKSFGAPGSISSLSGGFVDVSAISTDIDVFTVGLGIYQSLSNEIDALSCPEPRTALGDALCDTIDEHRAFTDTESRIGLITDAGENGSLTCGGSNYVNEHILPRAFDLANYPNANINFDLTILTTDGGNVSSATQTAPSELELLDSPLGLAGPQSASRYSQRNTSEVESLRILSLIGGGSFNVVGDNETVPADFNPFEENDNGGGLPF